TGAIRWPICPPIRWRTCLRMRATPCNAESMASLLASLGGNHGDLRMPTRFGRNNLPGLTVPWSLYTGPGAGNAGIDAAFSYAQGQGNQATFTIQVYDDDVEVAIQDCLGTNLYNKDTGTLDRRLPIRHPRFDWMYCERVTTVRPQGFEK